MALQDENSRLRARRAAAKRLLSWERRHMAINDRNHGRKKREKKDILTDKLLVLKKLLSKWDRLLQKEASLVEQARRKRRRHRKKEQKAAQQRDALKKRQLQQEERLKRECIRKRMRSDCTMDDILGKKKLLPCRLPMIP